MDWTNSEQEGWMFLNQQIITANYQLSVNFFLCFALVFSFEQTYRVGLRVFLMLLVFRIIFVIFFLNFVMLEKREMAFFQLKKSSRLLVSFFGPCRALLADEIL